MIQDSIKKKRKGREVRDNFMRESAHSGASAWDVSTSNFKTSILSLAQLCDLFLLLISKQAFYRWLNFAISWRLYNRRNGLPQHSSSTSRCFADRERRDDEGLYAPAVPDLHIDLL